MTNPSNMVRVRARNGGRASVYEANGWAQAYTQGLLAGYGVTQNLSADMNVLVGGTATSPDVVLATNPAGYKVALDLVSTQAVAITAPATNKRISAIVAYTDDLSLPTTEDTVTGSPASCGLIVVNGTAAANPTEPTDNQIRTAITSDGATGSQAAYCVIATILVASGTTAITNDEITVKKAGITSNNIDFATYSTSVEMPCGTWVDGRTIYKKTIYVDSLANAGRKTVPTGISNIYRIVNMEGIYSEIIPGSSESYVPINMPLKPLESSGAIRTVVVNNELLVDTDLNRTLFSGYVTLYYTKTS